MLITERMRTRRHSRSRVGMRGGTRGKGSKRKSQKASLSRRTALSSLRIMKKPVSRKQITTAHNLLDRMGISTSARNVRTWLQSTSERNLTPSARELVSKYDEAVRSSAQTLRNAAKLETMTGKYGMLYRESTKHKKLSAIKEVISSFPRSFENVKGKFKTASKPFGRLNPDDASYFLLYIHTHFVTPANRPFQPLLIPKEIKEVSYDTDLLIKKYGQDEEELIKNIESKEKHQIIQYLMEQARSPSIFELPDENELGSETDPNLKILVENIAKSYKNVYLAQGKMNIKVNKYTSPLETIVKNEYAAGEPIPFFFVFQTPKGIIAAHQSHVSILVLYSGKWYSLGLGYSGFIDDKEAVPSIQRVGLYNPDHVIGIEGSDSDDIPHHLRLIDYGVFKKKHFDRIMRIVEHKSATIKGAGPMVATFGREEEEDDGETQFIVGGLTSQIIPINMQYKYFTCAANKPDSLNCTSFAQYVFSERIECSVVGAMGGAGGFVVPNFCKRKKHPITAEKLQEFINVFEGTAPITAELIRDLTWE